MKHLFKKLTSPKAFGLLVLVAISQQYIWSCHNVDLLRSARYVGDANGPQPKDLIGTIAANAPDAPQNKKLLSPGVNASVEAHNRPQTYMDPYLTDRSRDGFIDEVTIAMSNEVNSMPTPALGFFSTSHPGTTDLNNNLSLSSQGAVDPGLGIKVPHSDPISGPRHLYLKTNRGLLRFQIASSWTLTNSQWSKIQSMLSIEPNFDVDSIFDADTPALFNYRDERSEDPPPNRSFDVIETLRIQAIAPGCTPQTLKMVTFSRTPERSECDIGKLVSAYRYKRPARQFIRPKFFVTLSHFATSESEVNAYTQFARSPANIEGIENPSLKPEWYERRRRNR